MWRRCMTPRSRGRRSARSPTRFWRTCSRIYTAATVPAAEGVLQGVRRGSAGDLPGDDRLVGERVGGVRGVPGVPARAAPHRLHDQRHREPERQVPPGGTPRPGRGLHESPPRSPALPGWAATVRAASRAVSAAAGHLRLVERLGESTQQAVAVCVTRARRHRTLLGSGRPHRKGGWEPPPGPARLLMPRRRGFS